MKALIIDDSRTMRRLLSSYVSVFSIETVEAGDGREALDVLGKEGPVDLALVDWDMPVMSGIDFVKGVRADRRYDGMKLMMVTAHTSMDDIGQALERGANDFLMKPFTEAMVADKLRVLGLVD
jgi:two-component system chemotaxis response regulator CheY